MSREGTHKQGETQHEQIQLVSFNLGEEEYAVEVLKVREILRMATITHIPNAPAAVEGIINLRGRVIPIISLRSSFGMPQCESSHNTRIMVMEMEGRQAGFIVDGVSEVIRISSAEVKPPPPMVAGGVDQEAICGVIQHGEQLLLLLQLEQMFPEEHEAFKVDEGEVGARP